MSMTSFRQRLAFKKMVENGGNISKAMRDTGYSANTAKTPQKLTSTRGWQTLMQSILSDEELIEAHKNLLKAKTLMGTVDTKTVISALDMAYRLKGYY